MEQAEGVDVVQPVVAEPVAELAVVAQLGAVLGLRLVLQVAVGALSLELLGPPSLQPPLQPADAKRRRRRQKERRKAPASLERKAHLSKNRAAFPSLTYGPVNSKTLLMVCLSTIMMAIWMKRSVRQPLGWHCKG